ncbi:MAG: alpha/beta fold hydrolase [Bacteroidota bacterium]
MTEKFFHDKKIINYRDQGKGFPVVLLHGYLESQKVWDEFAYKLAEKYRVITLDLPGHGESDLPGMIATMDDMAEAVKAVLDHLKIKKAVVIGHSMGGYVTLAFAENFPELLKGFGLFHSVASADPPEKKQNRDREIHLVKEGKKELIINTNIPKMFSDRHVATMVDEVEYVKRIALKTPERGIIAALEGMKQRPERLHVLKDANVPVLFIAGMKDNYIPFSKIEEQSNLVKNCMLVKLENSGHEGFMEEFEISLEAVSDFLEKCEKTRSQYVI